MLKDLKRPLSLHYAAAAKKRAAALLRKKEQRSRCHALQEDPEHEDLIDKLQIMSIQTLLLEVQRALQAVLALSTALKEWQP